MYTFVCVVCYFILCSLFSVVSLLYRAVLFSIPFYLHVLVICLNFCVDNVRHDSPTDGIIERTILILPSSPMTSSPSFKTLALLNFI